MCVCLYEIMNDIPESRRGPSPGESPENQRLSLENVPKNASRIIESMIDEMQISTEDRSPEEARALATKVIDALNYCTAAGGKLSNKELSERILDTALSMAIDRDEIDVAYELRAIGDTIGILARRRKRINGMLQEQTYKPTTELESELDNQ